MELIPVLDLKGGVVVRGVAGERERYAPNRSLWTDSSDPIETALALRDHLGLNHFYVADLDAISETGSHQTVIQALDAAGCQLLIDAGFRTTQQAMETLEELTNPLTQVVFGLESLPNWQTLADTVRLAGPERCGFSLDLKHGIPLGPLATGWTPLGIYETALKTGVRTVIVLDLAGVGVGRGVPTRDLCQLLRPIDPDVTLITGGGVRNPQDLDELDGLGLDGVLVASALHDGHLFPVPPTDCT